MMLKFILLVSTCVLPTANCNNCASGPNGVHRFGSKFCFMCHCKDNAECDAISGECPSGCASMWYGPGCQYRDMAEGEYSRHSDNLVQFKYSNLANDGNSSTCSYTAEVNSTKKKTNPFWRVWLPTQETIRELMIVTQVEALENFTNFSVYVENVSEDLMSNNSFVPSERQECYKHEGVVPRNETIFVLCKTPVTGNQVRIELAALQTQLILCDVRINGGRNMAFGRNTSQSSRYQDGNQPNDMCTSEKAVDGDGQQSSCQQCSLTNDEENPWWQLNIGHRAQIWYARIVSGENSRNHSTLQLDVSDSTNREWVTISNHRQENTSLNTIAHFVKLTMSGNRNRLNLCEVNIFGDCPEEICGYDCNKECHCKDTNIWDKILGTCSSGCRDRWTGTHCNFSCDDQHWGPQCRNKCGHCLNLAPCDVSTGECPNGCQEGYNPPKCNSTKQQLSVPVCLDGKYGTHCNLTCSGNCNNTSVCDKTDGHCPGGCKDGYTGDMCDQKCNNGTYGMNCSKKCSDHCKGGHANCRNTDGTCMLGCNAGWDKKRCRRECKNGTYGLNCSETCPENCKNNTQCNNVNGICKLGCKPGYEGEKCTASCSIGKFGQNCSETCPDNCKDNTTCNNINGHCDHGCKPGYQGNICNETCGVGMFGQNCSEACPDNCKDNTTCNNINGHCDHGCKPSYHGYKCNETCSFGKYGQNCSETCPTNCKDNTTCNNENGHCDHGCKPGYQGKICNETCSFGKFGQNCYETCPDNCKDNTKCNNKNGHCDHGCKPGYHGNICNETCSFGKFGQNCSETCTDNCNDNTTCNSKNGHCDHGCKPGYQGKICNKMCSNGTYGYNCSETCPDNCKDNTHCNNENGHCENGCKPGYHEEKCTKPCSFGMFGQNCLEFCPDNCKDSTTCNNTNGHCDYGCKPGYHGRICNETLQQPDDLMGSTAAKAVTIAIVLIITAVVTFAIIYILKIRQRKEQQRNNVELPLDRTECVNANATASPHANRSTDQRSRESTVYTNAVYADVSKQSRSAIPISALADYVKKNVDQIVKEFQNLPFGMQYSCAVGTKPSNRGKNRYKDMYAYDHSRVVLETFHGEEDSDYINACFIKGYVKEQAYIAAQGPIESTLDDFWRMIWEKGVNTVAMLTNLVEETKKKCLQYWPSMGTSIRYGDYTVCTDSEMIFSEFTIREFKVSCEGKPPRDVRQFHYTAWPDKSVPRSASSLLHFWRKVRTNDGNKSHPWLVHCSAGVGRTGTFIATDILYDQVKAVGYCDIYQCVVGLRDQRVNMVQTKSQYMFLYGLVTETFISTPEPVSVDTFHKMANSLNETDQSHRKTNLFLQYQKLNEDIPYVLADDNNEDKILAAKLPENKNKNRNSDIIPLNEFRPFLLTNIPNCTNYINAVYMPGYCEIKGYILTQTPLKTTAIDFCRLAYEQEVKVIVSFDENVKQEVGTYIPENGSKKLGPFTLTKNSEEDKTHYKKRTFNLSYESENWEITHLEFKAWPSSRIVPSDPHVMMQFIQEVEYCKRVAENKPVIVQCLNGSDRSGLFIVLVNILDRARFDNEVSIPQVIRQLRVRREQIIPNFEQFKFCYDVLLYHIDSNTMYANM